jgi:hypothetical protein
MIKLQLLAQIGRTLGISIEAQAHVYVTENHGVGGSIPPLGTINSMT